MRRLIFDSTEPRAAQRWAMAYEGFALTQPGARTLEVMRREGRVLDRLEDVSELVEGGGRRLKAGRHEVVLEPADLDILAAYVERAPWAPRVARDVIDLLDWLRGAESV